MQATVEVLDGLERKIIVKTPENRVDQEVEKRLQEMLPQLKLEGFRPGKAPMHLLRQRFGTSIRYEVIGQVIDATYREAISKEKIMPAGMPNIKIIQDKEGAPLEYYATVEIYPEVKLQSLNAAELENIKVDITPKDVDEMIHKLRLQKANWKVVDRPSQKGDRAIISFEGRQNGELFEGSTGKEIPLEIGSGMTIPGFEEGFTGHKAGEEIVLNLTFPTEYPVASLAAKPVAFKGTIHKVEEPELPPLDEDFAKQFGIKEGGIDQLRITVLENMQREVAQKTQDHLKGQVLSKLLELHPIALPKVLVQQEIKKLQEQEQSYLSQISGGKQKISAEPRAALRALAQRRVHLGLVFGKFMEQEKITADSERVNKLIEEIAASYGNTEMVKQTYRTNKELYRQLEEKVIEDELVGRLISQAKQIEKTMKYAEFKGFKLVEEDLNHA